MKGRLAVVGGGAILLFLLVMCSAANFASRTTSVSRLADKGVVASSDSSCRVAMQKSNQATDYSNNDHYQKAYDTAVSGLNYLDRCDDDDSVVATKPYLLAAKAYSEHHLSSGDSATDLRQAITLFQECQTHPGFYGTHVGAQCETEEDTAIRIQTQWEMNQY